MSVARHALYAALLLVSACAPSTAERADIGRAITSLQSEDRVERTLGAIAAQHVIKRQGRFSLLDHTELRWWQQELAAAVPLLVRMLSDDAGLEWLDPNGSNERTTTPRKEAVAALVGLERAAVPTLIAALDDPERARRAQEVLQQITGGRGPGDPRAASWLTWWQGNQSEALPHERGQAGKLLVRLLGFILLVAAAFWYQRRRAARQPERPRLAG